MINDSFQNFWVAAEDEEWLVERWSEKLKQAFPDLSQELRVFFDDNDKGFHHSYEVLNNALKLSAELQSHEGTKCRIDAIEQLAVFHDIGKFFQKLHSFDNLRIAQDLYSRFVETTKQKTDVADIVLDGIPGTDFYCKRLNPNERPPKYIEGQLVRAADKMLDNLVRKVDRYWFEYGVPRGARFFDPMLTTNQRKSFNFANFSGDQLNVLLTIIALRDTDFGHPYLGKRYAEWAEERKLMVVDRIMELASEIDKGHVKEIGEVVQWYRNEFNC